MENFKLSVCSNCFSYKPGICKYFCDKCEQIYYCSKTCKNEDSESHTLTECRVLTRMAKEYKEYESLNDLTKTQLRLFTRLFGIAHEENLTRKTKSVSFSHVLCLVANKEKFLEKKPEKISDFKLMHSLMMKLFADEPEVVASNPFLREEELFIELFCKLECNCFGIWDQVRYM